MFGATSGGPGSTNRRISCVTESDGGVNEDWFERTGQSARVLDGPAGVADESYTAAESDV